MKRVLWNVPGQKEKLQVLKQLNEVIPENS